MFVPSFFLSFLSCLLACLLSCFLAFLLSCFLAFLLACFLAFLLPPSLPPTLPPFLPLPPSLPPSLPPPSFLPSLIDSFLFLRSFLSSLLPSCLSRSLPLALFVSMQEKPGPALIYQYATGECCVATQAFVRPLLAAASLAQPAAASLYSPKEPCWQRCLCSLFSLMSERECNKHLKGRWPTYMPHVCFRPCCFADRAHGTAPDALAAAPPGGWPPAMASARTQKRKALERPPSLPRVSGRSAEPLDSGLQLGFSTQKPKGLKTRKYGGSVLQG